MHRLEHVSCSKSNRYRGEELNGNRSYSYFALLGSSLQQLSPCCCYVHSMAAAADNPAALDQMQLGSHHFARFRVKPWRHAADGFIDWAIGAPSQGLQLCDGAGLLCNEQEALKGQEAGSPLIAAECFQKGRQLPVWVPVHCITF